MWGQPYWFHSCTYAARWPGRIGGQRVLIHMPRGKAHRQLLMRDWQHPLGVVPHNGQRIETEHEINERKYFEMTHSLILEVIQSCLVRVCITPFHLALPLAWDFSYPFYRYTSIPQITSQYDSFSRKQHYLLSVSPHYTRFTLTKYPTDRVKSSFITRVYKSPSAYIPESLSKHAFLPRYDTGAK